MCYRLEVCGHTWFFATELQEFGGGQFYVARSEEHTASLKHERMGVVIFTMELPRPSPECATSIAVKLTHHQELKATTITSSPSAPAAPSEQALVRPLLVVEG